MADSLNIDGLEKILKALKGRPPVAKVGVLGSTAARSGGSVNNATIGAAHEYGTTTIPQRSFLRIPLTQNLRGELESSGAFSKQAFDEVVKKKSLLPWVEKLAIIAEGIVLDAFDQQGPGWAPLSPKTLERKKVKQILTETQQLRNSISSEVVEGG